MRGLVTCTFESDIFLPAALERVGARRPRNNLSHLTFNSFLFVFFRQWGWLITFSDEQVNTENVISLNFFFETAINGCQVSNVYHHVQFCYCYFVPVILRALKRGTISKKKGLIKNRYNSSLHRGNLTL